jgi:hypothetical protein
MVARGLQSELWLVVTERLRLTVFTIGNAAAGGPKAVPTSSDSVLPVKLP